MAFQSQSIRVFDLDDINDKKRMSVSDSRILDHVPVEMEHNEDGISDDLLKLLHTNPFLYYPTKNEIFVPSIEEFYVKVNNNSLALGSLIRGDEYKKGKKKAYVKKAFKNWYTDFLNNKNRILTIEGSDESVKAYLFNKIATYIFPLLIILLFITIFLGYQTGQAWTVLESKSFYPKIEAAFTQINSHSWFKVFTEITMTLIFVGFIYGLIYNKLLNDNRKLNLYRGKLFESSKKVIQKDFKTKFEYTKKYYLKKIGGKDKMFAPLPIHKTVPAKVNLKEFEEFTNAYKLKSANLKDKKTILNILKYMTVYLSMSGALFILVYSLYFIIKNFL